MNLGIRKGEDSRGNLKCDETEVAEWRDFRHGVEHGVGGRGKRREKARDSLEKKKKR